MKIKVSRTNLQEGLRKVQSVVGSRSTIPVLSNVLVAATDGRLTLSTTDLEVSISTSIPATVEEDGETTLPARKFGQIAGVLPGDEVDMVTDAGQTTVISSGRAKFKIMGLDSAEFPKEPDFQEDCRFTMPAVEFGKSLKKISYAVSTDHTRYVLNGILLSLREGTFTAVATDGRRLALVEKVLEDPEVVDRDVILPIKVVNELVRLAEEDGEVIIRLSESRAAFTINDTLLISKLVDGQYPNYRQVIPSSFRNSVGIPRPEFAEVLARVAIVVSDSSSSVRFELKDNVVGLSASSSDIGEADEALEVAYTNDPVSISFNPGFLQDPLRHLECDQLTMEFNDEFKPVKLLGDEGFLYIIMPMRN